MNKFERVRSELLNPRRVKITMTHLIVSLLIHFLLGAIVIFVWYPVPYLQSSGGLKLITQVFVIDMVLGSLLVCMVSNTKKKLAELVRDLMVIISLQLAAFIYGAYIIFLARPMFLIFEYDRFRVVHAPDIAESIWESSAEGKSHTIWSPLKIKGLRDFRSDAERNGATLMALNGFPLAFQSQLWSEYGRDTKGLNQYARPLESFLSQYPIWAPLIFKKISKINSNAKVSDFVYATMIDRDVFWTVFLNKSTMEPVFFLPVDSF